MSRSGTSVGLVGNAGVLRSMSGGSCLTEIGTVNLRNLGWGVDLGFGLGFRLEDFEIVGAMITSRGGVNVSLGGSYGGILGVRLLRRGGWREPPSCAS